VNPYFKVNYRVLYLKEMTREKCRIDYDVLNSKCGSDTDSRWIPVLETHGFDLCQEMV